MPLQHSQTSTSLTSATLPLTLNHKPDPRESRSHNEELSSSFGQEVPKTKEGEAEQLYNEVLRHNNRYFILDAELRKTELESLQLSRLSSAIEKSIASEEALEEDIKTQLKEKQEKLNLKIDETKGKLTELESKRYTALKEASQLFKPCSPNGQIEASTEKNMKFYFGFKAIFLCNI